MTGVLETGDLILRLSGAEFAPELLDFYARNRDFFLAFDPARDAEFYTLKWQRDALSKEAEQAGRREAYRFYLFPKENPGAVIGMVGLNNIVWGAFLSCFMSYKLDGGYLNRGYATRAVNAAVGFAFKELGLHRVECNIMPRNAASLRVAEKCGFRAEGLARKYLRINGVWEDHVHMVRINEDP